MPDRDAGRDVLRPQANELSTTSPPSKAEETAVIHFEKAMSHFEGLYQVVNQWFCRNELGRFEFVNREQDLGIPGLRRAKESYHPHHMVK